MVVMLGGSARNTTRHGACQVDRRLPGQISDQQISDAFRAIFARRGWKVSPKGAGEDLWVAAAV